MDSAAKRFAIVFSTLTWFAAAFLMAPVPAANEPASSSAEMLPDAELHSIFFLDPDRGWAVGDRGVIWQTETGGRHWQLIDSPTTARLQAIHFANPQNGWIAGGWIHAGSLRSSGVLLRTEDGGKKWTSMEMPTLPALRHIEFSDKRNGWAVGDCSAFHACGYLRTRDGGYTWESLPAAKPFSVTTGALFHFGEAFLIGEDGAGWSAAQGAVAAVGQIGQFGVRPRAVRSANGRGWLVGEQGTILRSEPGLRKWNPPSGKIPAGMAEQFDWLTVAVRDKKCWIAGRPGSVVLHSPDEGRTWRIFRTGQSLPMNQLFFLDDQHGWATGPLGRIMATRDGGQTWRVQLSGGERAALYAVHDRALTIPFEVVAKAAADDGFLTAAAIVMPSPGSSSTGISQENLFREAFSGVGTSVTNTILRSTALAIAAPSDSLNQRSPSSTLPARDAAEMLEEQLVRNLRMWRPDVVLTDSIHKQRAPAAGPMVSQIVLQAVQRAADPAVYPDQIVVAGLQPWTVRKLLGVVEDSDAASVVLDTGRLSMQLGSSLADYTVTARNLLLDSNQPVPGKIGCRLIWSQATQDVATRGLFSGIPPAAVGDNRRATRTPPPARVDGLARTAQQLRQLQEVANHRQAAESTDAALRALIEPLLQGHDPATAGRLLYRVAQQFAANGDYESASTCCRTMIERLPNHALNDAASLWLLRYHSSAELQHAFGPRRTTRLPGISPGLHPESDRTTAQAPSTILPATFAQPTFPALPGKITPEHLSNALRFAEQIHVTNPALYVDPRVQFPLVAVQRRMGNTPDATRLLNVLVGSQLTADWRTTACSELRRLEPPTKRDTIPEPHTMYASKSTAKPVLDGEFNEPFWQSGPWTQAGAPGNGPVTELKLSFDNDFLFVAIRCSLQTDLPAQENRVRRVRDGSLSLNDRVEFDVDLDRDYQTYFRFTVDQRGWTNDACCSDLEWNPEWFVACHTAKSTWSIEAAIPLAELGVDALANETWCLRCRRLGPQGAIHSWPVSAGIDSPSSSFAALKFGNH